MSLPPLPGLKPNEAGGYDVCPKCVAMWAAIILAACIAFYIVRHRKAALNP